MHNSDSYTCDERRWTLNFKLKQTAAASCTFLAIAQLSSRTSYGFCDSWLTENELSTIRWMCSFNFKGKEEQSLVGLNQLVCQLRGADCGSLDMLNVKMMQTGSNDVRRCRLMELGWGDVWRRLGGIALQQIWSFGSRCEDREEWRWRIGDRTG